MSSISTSSYDMAAAGCLLVVLLLVVLLLVVLLLVVLVVKSTVFYTRGSKVPPFCLPRNNGGRRTARVRAAAALRGALQMRFARNAARTAKRHALSQPQGTQKI
jgi:ABC-type molybdate transport system substrate-binding protein